MPKSLNPLKANTELAVGAIVLKTGWSVHGATVLVAVSKGLNKTEQTTQLNAVKEFFTRMNRALNNMIEAEKHTTVTKPPEPTVQRPVEATPKVQPPPAVEGLHL